MSRFERPKFNSDDQKGLGNEALNALLFDWWCDEGDRQGEAEQARPSDRLRYFACLHGVPTKIPSRALQQDDPAPPLTEPAPQGMRQVYLLSRAEHLREALTDTVNFSNRPYAALGGAGFLLAIDPGLDARGVDWHAEQQALVNAALGNYQAIGLRELAHRAVEQAALVSLARDDFDLAEFADQAALRYLGQLYGYGVQDHPLLQEASCATYRALQYLAVGQHFVTEPGTLPAAREALGRLTGRTSELMDEYTRLARSSRRYGPTQRRGWPTGVQPWTELDIERSLGQPLLRRLPGLTSQLSGRDRATMAATLLAGTLGNIASAVCLLLRELLAAPADEREALRNACDAELETALERRLASWPPVPVIPRRTLKEDVELGGVKIPADTDCLLLLEAEPGCPHAHEARPCPRVWGGVAAGVDPAAVHACLGRQVSMPLIAALVRYTLRLKGLKHALDPLTGERMKLERLWGFACTRFPLRHDRDQRRKQQNLIVAMRVKPPVSENAARLRRFIAAAVPRIDHELTNFGGVHFAWFEFSDDDSQLVLRTLYDGSFDPYVHHFAVNAGDLFDVLFDYLEGAPPRPVAEHPREFVETLRRLNRAPLAGYLFSAYPRTTAVNIQDSGEAAP